MIGDSQKYSAKEKRALELDQSLNGERDEEIVCPGIGSKQKA